MWGEDSPTVSSFSVCKQMETDCNGWSPQETASATWASYLSRKAASQVHSTGTSFGCLEPQHDSGGEFIVSRAAAGLLLHREALAVEHFYRLTKQHCVDKVDLSTASPVQASHLHFHHMDGVPASFNLLRSIASLLDENDSSKSMIQVPEVHRGHTTLKITRATTDRGVTSDTQWWLKRQTAGYSQVSVLIKSIISFDLQFPQAGRRHRTIFNRRVVLITPWRSKRLK